MYPTLQADPDRAAWIETTAADLARFGEQHRAELDAANRDKQFPRELYRELGGEVIFYGKPHRPIYDQALAKAAAARGAAAPARRTLAIGDSLRTDIAGARALGIDALFVSGGIHAGEFGSRGIPSAAALAAACAAAGVTPNAVMPRLMW